MRYWEHTGGSIRNSDHTFGILRGQCWVKCTCCLHNFIKNLIWQAGRSWGSVCAAILYAYLAFFLFPSKAFYTINSSLPLHFFCCKIQIQQQIKSNSLHSTLSPISLNSLQITTVNSLEYTLNSPVPCFTHTESFVQYHIYCFTTCFLHLTIYLGDLPTVLCILSPYSSELLHSTP